MTQEALDKQLLEAVKVGDLSAVKQAIADGANVHAKGVWDDPLTHTALVKNYEDIALYLLEQGVDPNAKAKNGMMTINHAALRSEKVAHWLLDRDVALDYSVYPPIFCAIQKNFQSVFERMLARRDQFTLPPPDSHYYPAYEGARELRYRMMAQMHEVDLFSSLGELTDDDRLMNPLVIRGAMKRGPEGVLAVVMLGMAYGIPYTPEEMSRNMMGSRVRDVFPALGHAVDAIAHAPLPTEENIAAATRESLLASPSLLDHPQSWPQMERIVQSLADKGEALTKADMMARASPVPEKNLLEFSLMTVGLERTQHILSAMQDRLTPYDLVQNGRPTLLLDGLIQRNDCEGLWSHAFWRDYGPAELKKFADVVPEAARQKTPYHQLLMQLQREQYQAQPVKGRG